MNKKCIFCEEGSNFSFSKTFLNHRWPYPDRVVFSDESVFAVVGSGPQVVPYILMIPYRHIYSMAEMNESERTGFLKCLDFLNGKGCFSQYIDIFEHGGESMNSSASIDHCHIHVIDGKWKLFENVKWEHFNYIGNFEQITWEHMNNYLLVGKYIPGTLHIKITKDDINEHQYFRKRLAEIIGDKHWNWKDNINYEKMLETMRLFRSVERSI